MMKPAKGAAVLLLTTLTFAGSAPSARAAEFAPPDAPLTWKQVGADTKYVWTRPAHLGGAGWARLLGALGAGAALYLVRDEIQDYADDHHNDNVTQVLDAARNMGKVVTPVLASSGFYFTGLARDSAYDKETATLLLETLGNSAAIAGIGQRVLATERPRDGDDIVWFGSGGGHSVSGDVTVAASLLAPIIDRHLTVEDDDGKGARFWKRFGAGAMYGTAGLVALQRIDADAHWAPDVYFGYINGLFVGRMLVDSRRGGREKDAPRPPSRVSVRPTASGLVISWR